MARSHVCQRYGKRVLQATGPMMIKRPPAAIYIERQSATIAETLGIPARMVNADFRRPIGRRGLFALALGGALAGLNACSTPDAAPAVATVPPPVTPADPAATSMADKIKLISDTVGTTLPKLGVNNDKMTAGLSIVSQLAELAGKATAGGGSLSTIAQGAVGLIGKLAPFAFLAGPYAPIIKAALAMSPAILQLVGIHARQAPGAMAPHEAEAVLRHARGY